MITVDNGQLMKVYPLGLNYSLYYCWEIFMFDGVQFSPKASYTISCSPSTNTYIETDCCINTEMLINPSKFEYT